MEILWIPWKCLFVHEATSDIHKSCQNYVWLLVPQSIILIDDAYETFKILFYKDSTGQKFVKIAVYMVQSVTLYLET